jgi:hypothetical protein
VPAGDVGADIVQDVLALVKESRVGDPAPDGADGPLELDAVGIDSGAGGRGADQGADCVAGQEVATDLLVSYLPGTPSAGPGGGRAGSSELGVVGLVLVVFGGSLWPGRPLAPPAGR